MWDSISKIRTLVQFKYLSKFPAYVHWHDTLHSNEGLVGMGYATMERFQIADLFFFGKKPGFARIDVSIVNKLGNKLPGAIFLRGSSVGILMLAKVDDDICVVLVRQPRVAVGKMTLEIPAGMMDEQACFKTQMLQESLEETGVRLNPESLIDLGEAYVSPGASDEIIKLYAVWIPNFCPPISFTGTHEEHIFVEFMLLEDALQTVRDGKFWMAYGMAKQRNVI